VAEVGSGEAALRLSPVAPLLPLKQMALALHGGAPEACP